MIHVKAEDVKPHWPRVREGLAKLESLGPDWIPEDAYRALINGTAVLSLIGDDGFLIWYRQPGDDGRGVLFILALASFADAPAFSMLKHYKQTQRDLDELAKQMNCKRIRHISKHKEYASLGFKAVGTVYERSI